MSTLEELTDDIDAICMAELGDTISYVPSGSAALTIKAHPDYADHNRNIGGVDVMEQNIMLAVRKVDVPRKPVSADRVIMPKKPGKIYRPVNVGTDESGTHWMFELQEHVDA